MDFNVKKVPITPKYNEARRQTVLTHLKIFQNYINFVHSIFLCPFSIQFNKKTEKFYAVSKVWKKRTVLTNYIIVLCLVVRLGFIEVDFERLRNPNSSFNQYTAGISDFIWFLFLVASAYTFWFKREFIVEFLNRLQGLGLGPKNNFANAITEAGPGNHAAETKPTWKSKTALLLSLILPMAVVANGIRDFVALVGKLASLHSFTEAKSALNLTMSVSGKCMIDRSYMVFFGTNNYTNSIDGNYRAIDYAITVSYIILQFLANSLSHSGYYLTLSVSFIVWYVVRAWVKLINSKPHCMDELTSVLDNLDDLCKLLDCCTEAVGLLYCFPCLGLIPMYAMHLPELFQGDLAVQLVQIFNKTKFACIVFPAASVNAMMTSVHSWLLYTYSKSISNRSDDNLNCRVNMMFQKLTSTGVGLSGKCFLITYGFIGNAIGAVVTYGIIIIQFRNNTV